MRTRMIKIGDSYGVRIPKSFIEEAGLPKSFHILVERDEIVLRRYKNRRYGWATAFRKAVRKHGNALTEEDIEWLNAPLGPPPEEQEKRKQPRRKSAAKSPRKSQRR